jgi:predicted Zn-dependent protease
MALEYIMVKIKEIFSRTFLLKILAFFLLPLLLAAEAPAMTIQQERDLGQKVLQEVKKQWPLVQDPSVNEYVNRIGERILRGMESQPFDYRFFVINTTDVNAFSVPGGYVFINSGLILMVENEDELAGVIGHEIGHIVARHIAKRSEKGQAISLATLGAILAGILLGGPVAGAISTAAIGANQTAMLKFSRQDEEEADALGLKFMSQAGYDPHAMITMLKKFRRITGPASGDPPAYLLTHPAAEERASELEIQMARNSLEKVVAKPSGNLLRMQTKLIVAEKDIAGSVTYFENYVKRKPDDPEAFFGLGLAQKRMGALDWAIKNFLKAASLSPGDAEIYRELGIAYLLKANLPEARKNLERAQALSPLDPLTYFSLGRVYAEQKLKDEALQSFLRAKKLNPNLPEIDYHLGMAYGAKGMLGQAYQSLGYYYKSMGDAKTALLHFSKALTYFSEQSPERLDIEREIQALSLKKKEAR